jgi:hypothetical protein
MADDARMDFRYRDEAGVELEAFKVTPAGRWDTEHWPAWLQVQGSAREINKVYTDPASPNTLFINLESGRFGIEENAYIVYENGTLRVENGQQFEGRFEKVVPLPPRKLDPESLKGFERTHRVENGKLVKLTAEEIAALPPEEPQLRPELALVPTAPDVIGSQQLTGSDLRPKAEIAYEMMKEGDVDAGIKVLGKALADETAWCTCPPGQCAGGPRWGCRQNSPLVK